MLSIPAPRISGKITNRLTKAKVSSESLTYLVCESHTTIVKILNHFLSFDGFSW